MARFASWIAALVLCIGAATADARFHLWRFEQFYSNADGTVQFIVLYESQGHDDEDAWVGQRIAALRSGTVAAYVFTTNLPDRFTANKRALIASEGFAALGIITPDYVVPNGFLGTGPSQVDFANVDAISYQSLPTDGIHALNRNGEIVPNVATNYAGQSVSVTPAPPSSANYQGLWWNSPANSESGWGVNFTHQGDTIFASWFTFDLDGSPLWMVAALNKTAAGVYSGSLVRGTGPAFNSVPFNPALVVGQVVGTATVTFADTQNATFAYTIGNVSQTKNITPQVFGSPVPTCASGGDAAAATNYQDLWWAAPANSESGWGINFTHQGDTIFGTWFTYDLDGKPLWMVVAASLTAPKTYSGKLFRATGPAWSAAPFDPGKVAPIEVGNATLTFSDGNNASFAYTVNGETQTKPITRQVFGGNSTVCH